MGAGRSGGAQEIPYGCMRYGLRVRAAVSGRLLDRGFRDAMRERLCSSVCSIGCYTRIVLKHLISTKSRNAFVGIDVDVGDRSIATSRSQGSKLFRVGLHQRCLRRRERLARWRITTPITMGVPPHRYVSRRRLESAKTMIATGLASLCEIAFNCQFSSQSSFTRAFRRATGMTPAEYRRTLQ